MRIQILILRFKGLIKGLKHFYRLKLMKGHWSALSPEENLVAVFFSQQISITVLEAFSRPSARAPLRACLQAILEMRYIQHNQ